MTVVIERGAGIVGANAYESAAYVTAYLTARARETENNWSTSTDAQRNAAVIAATDYIEHRWGQLLRGIKEHRGLTYARGALYLAQLPTAGQTVTIGTQTYTFRASLSVADEVLIGANIAATIDNLVAAVNNEIGEGTLYGTGTVVNAVAEASAIRGNQMLCEALTDGTPGNEVATTTDVTNAEWTAATLIGGSDEAVSQSLSFPRFGLTDRDGRYIYGVPEKIKQAMAEYAVRARSADLASDPVTSQTGGDIIRLKEKVGPIETDTSYSEGSTSSNVLSNYPAADRLLREFIAVGGVIRG